MNIIKKIKKDFILECSKWIGMLLSLIMPIIAIFMCYDGDNLYFKNLIIFFSMLVTVGIFLTTQLGKLVVCLLKETHCELQKVVWPTYRDSLNTTAVVIAVTIMISLILWGLDTILVYLISFSLRF